MPKPGGIASHYMAMTLAMATAAGMVPYCLRREPKPERACRLYGCTNLTDHNGGYCCAEHCKRDRAVKRLLWDKLDIRFRGGRWRFDPRYPRTK